MDDNTLAKLREWLWEEREQARYDLRTMRGQPNKEMHACGRAEALRSVLDWLDRNAKGGQDELAR